MNEQQFIEALCTAATDDGKMHAGPFITKLQAVIAWLRANGITMNVILQDLFAIIRIINGGGDWQSIITALLALFGLPAGAAASAPA